MTNITKQGDQQGCCRCGRNPTASVSERSSPSTYPMRTNMCFSRGVTNHYVMTCQAVFRICYSARHAPRKLRTTSSMRPPSNHEPDSKGWSPALEVSPVYVLQRKTHCPCLRIPEAKPYTQTAFGVVVMHPTPLPDSLPIHILR
jgi:hypothetical protein